jgi:uncharacterized protein (TIGR02145 family)
VNPVTGYFNPSSSGTGNVTVTYSYTDFQSCSDTRSVTLHVLPAPAAGCGQAVTDPRDGKTYPTVLIGSQCWMQKNLDYGTMISAVTPQNENCVPEKYCPGDDASKCQNFGGLYQWDELMKYAATEGLQGVCLPGWHVPSMNDWMTLVNFYQGSGLAGKPLQDSIISGMRILESGVNYSNGTWKFAGFGTLLWTSTASGAWKALSHGMNNINYSVSDYISNRSNGFPVRCLRDY